MLLVVFNAHLKELNCVLVGETSHLGGVLKERDGSDSPDNIAEHMSTWERWYYQGFFLGLGRDHPILV